MLSLEKELKRNAYPGRGIIIGRSANGKFAVCAYFIMGRSSNSRNRIFVQDGDGIRTEAFEPSKLEDPSLVIYAPVRMYKENLIVSNGDQTDTIYEGLQKGFNFEQILKSREFEPDAPIYTPRISSLITMDRKQSIENNKLQYEISILKSNGGNPDCCNRFTFSYDNPVAGEGHFIHTYQQDGNPPPSFSGEPKLVEVPDDINEFTDRIWSSLNEENKVSLFVRYIEIETGTCNTIIKNKNK